MSVRSGSQVSSGTSRLITFEYTWTIENIDRLCSEDNADFPVLCSPTFIAPPDKIVTEDKQPVEFELNFYPNGLTRERQDFVGMYLKLNNHHHSCLTILSTLSFVNAENGEKHRMSGGINKFYPSPGNLRWGSSIIMRRDELYEPANGYVSKGSLILHCEVNIILAQPDKPDLLDQLQQKYSQAELLATSYGDLLESGTHSDVTLVMVNDGGKELRAHKAILTTRSRVFADMFESKMAESTTNRVEIVESREVFKQALNFIYTGKVSSLDGIATDLLICADKYQLDPLKSICEEYLSESITLESDLSDLFALTKLHDAPNLQVKVLDSMRKDIETELMNVDKLVQIKALLSNLAADKKN